MDQSEIERKLLEGSLSEEEWEALSSAEMERTIIHALERSVAKAVAARKAHEGERVAAGALFSSEMEPPKGCEVRLPAGYALGPDGVYRATIQKEKGKVKAHVLRLTSSPVYVAARDAGSGRVKVVVRLRDRWYQEWVRASRLTVSKLADWFVFPTPEAEASDLLQYLRACITHAPFEVGQDEIAQAAVEILHEFFPHPAGVRFPALRAFAEVRQKCEECGVDPVEVRKWWSRMGLIAEGPSKVSRTGKTTARFVVFCARVREFLETASGADRGRDDEASMA